jgi:hypothetical protein
LGTNPRGVVVLSREPRRHLEAVEVGEVDVEQDHVGPQLGRGAQAGGSGPRLADDLVALGLEQQPGARAKALVVVHDQDTGPHDNHCGRRNALRQYG